MLGGNPGREVAVKCSGGWQQQTAFVWSDRVGMMLSSAWCFLLRPWGAGAVAPDRLYSWENGAVLHCIKCTWNPV